jgi:hypothetical protein
MLENEKKKLSILKKGINHVYMVFSYTYHVHKLIKFKLIKFIKKSEKITLILSILLH